MAVNLGEITALPMLADARVLSGKSRLEQKQVEWVSVIETPVENFVRQHEFVLSTGVGLGNDSDALLRFVEDVYESGASALALATGRHLYDIPKRVISFAEQRGFVLIEMTWEIRFSDVIHSCMEKINHYQQEELKRSEEVQQRLLEMVLQGGSCSDIARYVHKHLGSPVLITDPLGRVKGKAGCTTEHVTHWQRHCECHVTVVHDGNLHPLHKKMEKIVIGDTPGLLMRIQSAGKEQGQMVIFSVNHPNNLDTNLLEHATTAAALSFLKDSAIEETEMRLKDDFILSLANGEFVSKERLLSRGKLLGYNLTLPYVCVVGELDNLEELFRKNKEGFASYQHWFESMIYYVSEEILVAGETIQKRILTTVQESKLLIFLETTPGTNELVNQYLDLLERRLSRLLPGVLLTWGIGQHGDGVIVFEESYSKAFVALELGRKQKGVGSRIDYEDTKINRLLQRLSYDKDVQEVTMSTITPLVDYDEKRKMDLIGTFTAYHLNNGNVSQTARKLNLHRQSLLYRLRKIESLTRLSLMNPDDVFLLDLSIKIWSVGLRDSDFLKEGRF
ncbi:PucR family transcriptional regulator [Anaerobacillus sp. 1_MG-2023]|uniref:PucR family transcriptional regulator n=1 Tax=Anaerobacillus sp. 1_MG-2023 TaxID=3062655 RepID=UPI0026E287F5|nr:PucR family transcriptional regulator [Anaerobacillus sp. 1_MG-2023]MDO6654707.1 PucR family transcriptional regulator ligand-binding domain-containing protein [Anaerobacillus sp. 1_MG-2023]